MMYFGIKIIDLIIKQVVKKYVKVQRIKSHKKVQ